MYISTKILKQIFLSTLSLRRATRGTVSHNAEISFLSTLSLRRATDKIPYQGKIDKHFYPRSPCGERPPFSGPLILRLKISIHALLAESDLAPEENPTQKRDFYPRSPCGERLRHCTTYLNCSRFLSTLSLRRATRDSR